MYLSQNKRDKIDKLNQDANSLGKKQEEEKLIWDSQKIRTLGTLNCYSF